MMDVCFNIPGVMPTGFFLFYLLIFLSKIVKVKTFLHTIFYPHFILFNLTTRVKE